MRSHLLSLFHEDYQRQGSHLPTNLEVADSSTKLKTVRLPWETNAREKFQTKDFPSGMCGVRSRFVRYGIFMYRLPAANSSSIW